jgi:hypothetical protein
MKHLVQVGVCTLLIASLYPGLRATTVVELTTEDLATKAKLIVIGRCVALKSTWVDRNLVTLATISVSEVVKGSALLEVTVVLPGGVDANRKFPIAMTFPGAPRIMTEEEVFLFLTQEAEVPDGYTIMGFSQGKFSIVEDPAGEKMVSRDLSRVAMQEGATLKQGRATLTPLSAFKKEIERYLAPGSPPLER